MDLPVYKSFESQVDFKIFEEVRVFINRLSTVDRLLDIKHQQRNIIVTSIGPCGTDSGSQFMD